MVVGLLLPCAPSSFSTAKKGVVLRSSFHGVGLSVPAHKQLPSIRVRSSGVPIRMMAKKDEELKEIRAMSTDAINDAVVDLKGELQILLCKKSIGQQRVTTSEFGRMRRRIARMLTIRREREIEEGIGKRMSRKLDREWKKNVVFKAPLSVQKKMEEQKKNAA